MKFNGHDINITKLRIKYQWWYDLLYENAGSDFVTEKTRVACEVGEKLIQRDLDFYRAFCDGRTELVIDGFCTPIFDPLTSDREIAAYALALSSLY